MRLVAPVSAIVALRYFVEDIAPDVRISRPDMEGILLRRYLFGSKSDFNPLSPSVYQGGRAIMPDGRSIQVNELQISQSAIVVGASDSESVDAILDDLLRFLDDELGFKIRKNEKNRTYVSAVVVEFENNLSNILSLNSVIENIINEGSGEKRYLKRLSFGLPERDIGIPVNTTPTIDQIERAEFFIERRLGSKPEANRFFCSAPMRTGDLVNALGAIEAALPEFPTR